MEFVGVFIVSLAQRWQVWLASMDQTEFIWLCVGLGGQLLFMMRFVVQWLASEKAQRSVIPASFWYLSLAGGLAVLLYGLHKVEPVIIIGQLPGTFIYARNLVFIAREKARENSRESSRENS